MSTAQTTTETTALPAGVWTSDPIHSSLEFSVKHMVVATFRSSLPDFEADAARSTTAAPSSRASAAWRAWSPPTRT